MFWLQTILIYLLKYNPRRLLHGNICLVKSHFSSYLRLFTSSNKSSKSKQQHGRKHYAEQKKSIEIIPFIWNSRDMENDCKSNTRELSGDDRNMYLECNNNGYTYVYICQIHQTVHFKWIYFIICKSFFNKII